MEEIALTLKEIPPSSWSIVLTNFRNAFFYNSINCESTYDMPSEVVYILGRLIASSDSPPLELTSHIPSLQDHVEKDIMKQEYLDYYAKEPVNQTDTEEDGAKIEYKEEKAKTDFFVPSIHLKMI